MVVNGFLIDIGVKCIFVDMGLGMCFGLMMGGLVGNVCVFGY